MKSGKTPQSRRRDNRRKAAYAIQHKETARRTASAEEIAELFEAVDKKSLCNFGIVKLSVVDLDSFHDIGQLSWKQKLQLQSRLTLVGYASARGRDEIVAALLRAGANPCARYSPYFSLPPELLDEVQSCLLNSIPMTYSVWIVNKLSEMRESGLHRSAQRESDNSIKIADSCTHCGDYLSAFPVSWPECESKYIFCEVCVWKRFLDEADHQFFCPCGECGSELDHAMTVEGTLTPEDKSESYRRWAALPLGMI